MLNIFAVLSNERRSQLSELLSQLRNNFRADKILYGCFRVGVSIDIYVKLLRSVKPHMSAHGDEETYDILVFFSIVSYLRYCDRSTDIFLVRGLT